MKVLFTFAFLWIQAYIVNGKSSIPRHVLDMIIRLYNKAKLGYLGENISLHTLQVNGSIRIICSPLEGKHFHFRQTFYLNINLIKVSRITEDKLKSE